MPRSTRRPMESRRSEEHTSELQSHDNLVCRLLLEKKKIHHLDETAQRTEYNTTAPPMTHCVTHDSTRLAVAAPGVCLLLISVPCCAFFFFKDTAPPEISPLPLPTAFPF